MKKFLETLKALMLLMASALLLAVPACSESEETDPTPEPEKPLELVIKLGEITHNSILSSVTPSDEEATYYAAIHSAAEVGEDQGAALAQSLIAREDFASLLRTEAQRVTGSELTPESDYYVVAFGYNAEQMKMTSKVVLSDKITTAAAPVEEPEYLGELTLEWLEAETTWRDASMKVTSTNQEMEYVFGVYTKERYDAEFAEDPELIVAARIAAWEQDAENYREHYPNDTWVDYMTAYQCVGDNTFSVREWQNLRWSESYVAFVFGMNDEGKQTSPVAVAPFSTQEPTPSENVITITINQTTKESVEFTVTTTTDDPYFLNLDQKAYWDRFGDGEGQSSYDDLVFDQTFHLTDERIAAKVFTGSRTFTQEDLDKTVNGFNEYQIMAFGFENGPTTEVVFSEVFKPGTTHQVEPESAFEITVSEPTWCNATVDVKADPEIKYIAGGFTKAEWEEKYAADPATSLLEKHKATWERMGDRYGETWQQQIQYYAKSGDLTAANATDIIGYARLAWGTEYVIYLFGIDETTGELTTEVQSAEFSTLAPTPSSNTFAVVINSTTKSSVDFTITPSNDDPYYVTIEKKSTIEGWDNVIASTIPDNDTMLEQRTFTGTQTLTQDDLGKTVNGFGEYQVIVYGFENGPTTEVTLSEAFKPGTTHQPEPETAFAVTVSDATWCDATVDVKLNKETKYIMGGFTKADWDATYAADPNTTVFAKEKAKWERMGDMYGETWLQQIPYYTKSGEMTGNATAIIGYSRLAWDTEYVIYLFGVDESTGEMTTDVEYTTFKTAAPEASSNTFAITIDGMTRSSVEFTVTPTTDDPYYVTIEKKSTVDGWDDVIANTLPESDAMLEQRTFTGTQTLTQDDLGRTVSGFYEYYIVVYGFENGPTTEVTLSEAFKPADPE